MTKKPRSHDLEEILAGYVLGNLDEVEIIWLNEQLIANPQLNQQVSQLESTLNLMPYGLPEDVPDNNLRDRILAQTKSKPISSKRHWSQIVFAVTAVGTLLLGVNNFGLRKQITAKEELLQQQQKVISLLRQPNNQVVTLKANNDAVTTSGSLFISPERNTAVLTLANLDNLPGKQVYRLWAVSQDKKIGCSNFVPNAHGEIYLNLASDDALLNASSISITIEPEADTEQPLGQELLSGSFPKI